MLLWLLFGAAHGGIDIRDQRPAAGLARLAALAEWPAAMGAGAALLGVLLLAAGGAA